MTEYMMKTDKNGKPRMVKTKRVDADMLPYRRRMQIICVHVCYQ